MPLLKRDLLRCDAAGELLSAALDGELDPAEAAALDEHLAACAECAARGERLAEVRDAFRSLTPPAPPRDLASAVMDRIRAGEAGAPGGAPFAPAAPSPVAVRRRRRWTARVAAALLLAAGGAAAVWTSRVSDGAADPAPRAAFAALGGASLGDLGLDAGCGEGGNCLQLGPCDSPAECGGGPPCSDPAECGGGLR